MSLKKPTDLFEKKAFLKEEYSVLDRPSADEIPLRYSSENFVRYKSQVNTNKKSLNQIEELSIMINLLKEEVETKLDKGDLDTALYSYMTVLDDNFKSIESYVRTANRNDLLELKKSISQLSGVVDGVIKEDLPRYRKDLKKGEVSLSETVNNFKKEQTDIKTQFEEKLTNIANVIDSNLNFFNEKIEEEKVRLSESLKSIRSDLAVNEQRIRGVDAYIDERIKKVDSYLKENHKDLVVLKEEVFSEIKKLSKTNQSFTKTLQEDVEDFKKKLFNQNLQQEVKLVQFERQYSSEQHQRDIKRIEEKIDFIRETYSKIDPEEVVRGVLRETASNLSEPPSVNNSDPLTPLDQNFVTLEQLQEHYRLFLNRVQQQLSTLGGGGETQLKYLDDVVGIATNASAYDGQYLSYDHSLGKFVFSTPAADYSVDNWVDGINGVYTQTNVGIGSTVPQVALDIVGDVNITGVATATDFDTLSDVTLKTNVVIITDPLAKVQQLRGVNFEWKDTSRPSMGVIAQEVEEVLPQLVHGYETKSVNYNGLIGLLIECVKKQQEEINELKKRLP